MDNLTELEKAFWDANEFTAAAQQLKSVQKKIKKESKIKACERIAKNRSFSSDSKSYFWEKIAQLYFLNENFNSCLRIYKQKLEYNSNPRYLRAMGDCHRQLIHIKEALNFYRAALQISQHSKDDKLTAQILNSRGLIYMINKDLLHLAINDFLIATYKDMTNPLYCCNASCAFKLNQDKFNYTQYFSRADYLLTHLDKENCRLSLYTLPVKISYRSNYLATFSPKAINGFQYQIPLKLFSFSMVLRLFTPPDPSTKNSLWPYSSNTCFKDQFCANKGMNKQVSL